MNDEIKEWIWWGILIIVGAIIWRSCESCGKTQNSSQETNSSPTVFQTQKNQNAPVTRNNSAPSNSSVNESNSTITITESSSYSISSTNNDSNKSYVNYEETSDCVDGIVVYEGENDYYIVETRKGCSIVERYSGRLNEGDKVRGELNEYNYHYLINFENDSETKIYVEDYMLSDDRAIEWMGEHRQLKVEDQRQYDLNDD